MFSRSHPVAKRLRALRRDRSARESEGVFVAEGIHLAEEALAAGAPIELAVVAARLGGTVPGQALLTRLAAAGIPIHEAADATLDGLQDARSPQPVLLVVRRNAPSLDAVVRGRGGAALLVIAEGVQDPGNLGGLVRTADAAGATGFLATGEGADLFHPRTVRGTMGSIFRLPAACADSTEAIDLARREGLAVIGAVPRGGISYDRIDWRPPAALVLGGEGSGLSPAVLSRLNARVGIPMRQGVESLSVGAAAAVLLFEAARSRVNPAG
jgi:TrmH family RNA methyltransferase